MSLTYAVTSGELYDGLIFEGRGYSGHGPGLNNPAMEGFADVGPIPAGRYAIGPPHTHGELGPLAMRLTPINHDAHGRSGFFIHGDNSLMNHTASHGCIILGRAIRSVIAANGIHQIEVTA